MKISVTLNQIDKYSSAAAKIKISVIRTRVFRNAARALAAKGLESQCEYSQIPLPRRTIPGATAQSPAETGWPVIGQTTRLLPTFQNFLNCPHTGQPGKRSHTTEAGHELLEKKEKKSKRGDSNVVCVIASSCSTAQTAPNAKACAHGSQKFEWSQKPRSLTLC